MKKIVACILLVILMAAAFVPCCAEDNCADELSLAGTEERGKEPANCSPFFPCNTCGSFIVIAELYWFFIPTEYTVVHFERAHCYNVSPPRTAPWQPPKAALL